jgi:CheY-like chemotaxis protein
MRRMTPSVLMVDDNPGDLQLIEEAFRDCRMPVQFHSACDGEQALEQLERMSEAGAPPHLVILDLGLPGLPGRETIARLRALPHLAGIPVVVFSGEAGLDAASLGSTEAVRKPGSYHQYLALVRGLRRYWASRSSWAGAARIGNAGARSQERRAHRPSDAGGTP